MSGVVDKGVADAATGIAKLIGDPVLIVLTIVIVSLIVMLFLVTRSMDRKGKAHEQSIKELTHELHENSQTLMRLATLIEVLVHGRKQAN